MKTTLEMAREAGAIHIHKRPKEFAIVGNEAITRFAALVSEAAAAKERERIAKWYESEGHMMFPVAIPDAIRSNT